MPRQTRRTTAMDRASTARLPSATLQPAGQGLARERRRGGRAIEVLIAKEDARFSDSNWLGKAWARFLKETIGYCPKPLDTVLWSLGVMALGWLLVTVGAQAGVMRATWP